MSDEKWRLDDDMIDRLAAFMAWHQKWAAANVEYNRIATETARATRDFADAIDRDATAPQRLKDQLATIRHVADFVEATSVAQREGFMVWDDLAKSLKATFDEWRGKG